MYSRIRVDRYKKLRSLERYDYAIGCIILTQPFFLPEDRWVPVPSDWKPNIVSGKLYDLTVQPGKAMYEALRDAVSSIGVHEMTAPRYGEPVPVRPRLGQGAFRIAVTDAYNRRCVVTGERVLPVLEAAHVHPYTDGGTHTVNNGLLLRRDLHTLLDRGYITVTPEFRLEVSRAIREDFDNGHDYYAMQGTAIRPPSRSGDKLSEENIE